MSLRPRSEKKPNVTAIQSPMPVVSNLTRVLEVGIANRAAGEDDMIQARSFAEVDKLVDINDPLLSVNKQELNRLAGKASEYTNRAGDAAKRGAKKVARLTAKELQLLIKEVELKWKGSMEPFHFLTATPEQLLKELIADYQIHFKAKNWQNIKLAKNAARYYTPDSGANMHAKISFEGNTYTVHVFVSFQQKDPQLENLRDELQWGPETRSFGNTINVIKYEQASALINGMLKEGVEHIKNKLAKKPKSDKLRDEDL